MLPEEVVYLVERGSLDVRYRTTAKPEDETVEGAEAAGEEGRAGWNGVSMSLQACYAWFVGRDGLDLERYTVFAGLRRSGYIVLRAQGWYGDDGDEPLMPTSLPQSGGQAPKEEVWGIWRWLYSTILERKPHDPPPLGPLVGPGLYRSYSMVSTPTCAFRALCSAYTR